MNIIFKKKGLWYLLDEAAYKGQKIQGSANKEIVNG